MSEGTILYQTLLILFINGLVQERCNSIANALELCLSCPNPSIFMFDMVCGMKSKVKTYNFFLCRERSDFRIVWVHFNTNHAACINHAACNFTESWLNITMLSDTYTRHWFRSPLVQVIVHSLCRAKPLPWLIVHLGTFDGLQMKSGCNWSDLNIDHYNPLILMKWFTCTCRALLCFHTFNRQ